jgi:hypothetical protein
VTDSGVDLLRERLHETTRNLAVLEARLKAAERATERALALQAAEYERRLEILNHEAAKLSSMQATYVPRELFENVLTQLRADIADLKDYKSRVLGIVAFVSAVVALMVNVWWRGWP